MHVKKIKYKDLDATNDTEFVKAIKITEKRKVIIITNEKKTKKGMKKYYSYQLNIPKDFIDILPVTTDNTENTTYYWAIENKQKLIIDGLKPPLELEHQSEKLTATKNNKNTVSYTLPKRYLEYLQAYDIYQEIVNKYNIEKEDKYKFTIAPLYADIELTAETDIYYNSGESIPNLHFELKIIVYTNIENEFIDYVKNNTKNNIIPRWLDILINVEK